MLLERTPILYFRIAEVIARKACETLKIEVSPQLLISLSDHIHYAAERKKQNINVPNFMLNEIKTLYKREFKVGLWALKLIQANTEISFPEDEAGYIAMHIVNATLNNGGRSSNVSKSYVSLKMYSESSRKRIRFILMRMNLTFHVLLRI